MKLLILCNWCGKEFARDAAQLKGKKHHFCCRQCLADFSNKETRKKLREAHLGKGECIGYLKIYSRLAYQIIAEKILGKPLKLEEVVHHRAGNKYNHIPENLLVFPSVGEPTKFHSELRWFLQELDRLEVENAATK